MDKSLLLGLPVLLCCFRVLSGSLLHRDNADLQIVQCRMCHLQFPGEKCSRGRGICAATTDEACTVGRIFKKNGTPWLTFMGCLKNCANVKNIKWSVYLVTFECCKGYDLCNEKL
uniref:Prostate and testis expressed 1 n=1 Tax=Microcebus murinus TaxID=30608 RepID=A0A8C5VFV5_MICMU